jgi:hypothetical protein
MDARKSTEQARMQLVNNQKRRKEAIETYFNRAKKNSTAFVRERALHKADDAEMKRFFDIKKREDFLKEGDSDLSNAVEALLTEGNALKMAWQNRLTKNGKKQLGNLDRNQIRELIADYEVFRKEVYDIALKIMIDELPKGSDQDKIKKKANYLVQGLVFATNNINTGDKKDAIVLLFNDIIPPIMANDNPSNNIDNVIFNNLFKKTGPDSIIQFRKLFSEAEYYNLLIEGLKEENKQYRQEFSKNINNWVEAAKTDKVVAQALVRIEKQYPEWLPAILKDYKENDSKFSKALTNVEKAVEKEEKRKNKTPSKMNILGFMRRLTKPKAVPPEEIKKQKVESIMTEISKLEDSVKTYQERIKKAKSATRPFYEISQDNVATELVENKINDRRLYLRKQIMALKEPEDALSKALEERLNSKSLKEIEKKIKDRAEKRGNVKPKTM